MRCPDCNKFVSYDEPEVEEQNCDVSGEEVTAEVRMALPCAECGTELKEHNFELQAYIEHDCTRELYDAYLEGLDPSEVIGWDDAPEYELSDSDNWEATERLQDKTPNGKPIKSARYMKKFYGVEGTVTVKCLKCGEEFSVELKEEEQASGFDECC